MAMFRQLAKSRTKCFGRALRGSATKEYVLQHFGVGFDPRAWADTAGRDEGRLERIDRDQDIFAHSFDSSDLREECIRERKGFTDRAILLSRAYLRASGQLDLSFQPTRETWGHASQPTKVPSKVTLVGKTDGQRDLGQWQLRVTKQMSNMFQASLQQIAVGWRSNGLSESTCEMVRRKSGHGSKSFEAYSLVEMRFDVLADAMSERW
jgi:hypothetical protein